MWVSVIWNSDEMKSIIIMCLSITCEWCVIEEVAKNMCMYFWGWDEGKYLKKVNDAEFKEQCQVKILTCFQLQEIWMIMWTPIGLGKVLERMAEF